MMGKKDLVPGLLKSQKNPAVWWIGQDKLLKAPITWLLFPSMLPNFSRRAMMLVQMPGNSFMQASYKWVEKCLPFLSLLLVEAGVKRCFRRRNRLECDPFFSILARWTSSRYFLIFCLIWARKKGFRPTRSQLIAATMPL